MDTLILVSLILLSPLFLISLLPCLLYLGSLHPFHLVFIAPIIIENRTGRAIWVTPIGTHNSGKKYTLPQYAKKMPAIPVKQSQELLIEAGCSRKILYNISTVSRP
jgi:hypothetical protein